MDLSGLLPPNPRFIACGAKDSRNQSEASCPQPSLQTTLYSGFIGHRFEQVQRVLALDPRLASRLISAPCRDPNTLYSLGLTSAAVTMEGRHEAATVLRRRRLGALFAAWLSRLPPPFPNHLLHARPEEVLVFLETEFVPHHGQPCRPSTAGVPTRTTTASPSGVNGVISHLSTLFEELGRRGPYDPRLGTGNPCDYHDIKAYRQGYTRLKWRQGYQETRALPIRPLQVRALVESIDALAGQSGSPVDQLCYQRDALLILYSWASTMRGTEGGRLCLSDLHDKYNQPLFPVPCHASEVHPHAFPLPPTLPSDLIVLPTYGTKTNKQPQRLQDPIHLTGNVGDPLMCFIFRLWVYLQSSAVHGHPVSHFLFRPTTPCRRRFQEAPFSSSSFSKMLKLRLEAIGMYAGETPHSFRRGGLQATAQAAGGGPLGQLAAALHGRIRTPKVLARYLQIDCSTRGPRGPSAGSIGS